MTGVVWFLGGLARVHVPSATGSDGISVIEQAGRHGDSPPLHIHHTEDELFHVTEGQLDFQCGEERTAVSAGGFFLVPKGVAHSFLVRSDEARWLVTTTHGDFERFVSAVSRPPRNDGWPEPITLTEELSAELQELGARHGIEFVGPPLL